MSIFKVDGKLIATVVVLSSLAMLALPVAHAAQSGKGEWRTNFGSSLVFNDNVNAAAKNARDRAAGVSEMSDTIFNWNAGAAYKKRLSRKFSWRAGYGVNQSIYSRQTSANTFNQNLALGGKYRLSKSWISSLQYMYFWNRVDDRNFSFIHYLSPSVSYINKKFGMTRMSYTFKEVDNRVTPGRDNSQDTFAITQYIFFSDRKRRASIGYQETRDNTSSTLFDRDIKDWNFSYRSPLPFLDSFVEGVQFGINYKYSTRDYDTKTVGVTSVRRDDTQQQYSLRLFKGLKRSPGFLENASVEIKYTFLDNDSNDETKTYNANSLKFQFRGSF